MADDNAKLLIVLEAQSKKLQNQLADATRTIDRFAAQTNRRFDSMNAKNAASFNNLSKRVGVSMGALQVGIAKAFAGVAALRGAQQLIDASTRIENSLKIAGLAGEELDRVYDVLFASAQRNAAPVESLVDLYGKLAQVQKELGVTSAELESFTDNIAVAMRVSGKSAAESSGALLQLSQALGGGVVRAEEFNSILEGALPIAQAAAVGLEEAGGSVAKLRALVVDGKVSSEAFFRAFEAGSSILVDKVANAELTVSQQFVRLQNVLIDTAGKFDDATGASARVGAGLEELAGFIEMVGGAIASNKESIGWFVDRLGQASGSLPIFADILRGLEAVKALGRGSQEAAQDIGEIETATIDAIAAMVGLDDAAQFSPEQLATFQALIDRMVAGEAGADDLRAALSEMGLTPVNFMLAFSGLSDLIGKLQEARGEALATAAAVAAAASGQSSATNISDQRDEQLALRNAPARAVVNTISINDPRYRVPDDGKPKKGSTKQTPAEKFDDILKKQAEENRLLAERTALQATLNPLVNDYGFAIEKLNVQQELQTAATAAGLELTPALKASIDELATGYANASVEAARLAESQDQLKQISNDFDEAGKSAIKGFISDLREGKSAADALNNAMSSILDNVIEIGLNMLLGGGGGGLFGGIGKLFGFAGGGYTGNGGKNEPAGVVHRGEYVFTKAQTERLGVGNLARLAKGYANGGLVGAPGPVSAAGGSPQPTHIVLEVQEGAAFSTRILQVSGPQSAQISGKTVRGYDDSLGSRMSEKTARGL